MEIVREPPPVPPAPEKSPTSPSNIASYDEDNEPLYDSVCSDDDYGEVAENANLKNGGNVNLRNRSNQNSTVSLSSVFLAPCTLTFYYNLYVTMLLSTSPWHLTLTHSISRGQ